MTTPTRAKLTSQEWRLARSRHRERVQPWTRERVERSLRGQKHPVYDFLFEYYSFRPAHLERYSPGIDILLENANAYELDWPHYFSPIDQGCILKPTRFPTHRLPTVRWGIRFLTATLTRPPLFHCFGLHEWAMVYRASSIRHATPLRLTPSAIAEVVDSHQLSCTHFDAFRFFTPPAIPKNRFQLDRFSVNDFDQPGCIHVNMDLYKRAFHLAPYTSSDLVADTFDLARQAREIDMRASPYDLSEYGFSPITIETPSGRDEYRQYQKVLFDCSQPLRRRLLEEYTRIESLVSSTLPGPTLTPHTPSQIPLQLIDKALTI